MALSYRPRTPPLVAFRRGRAALNRETANTNTAEDGGTQKQVIQFWTKRLDHTINHTHSISKLLYTVEGALVALVSFGVKSFGAGRAVMLVAIVPTLVLAALLWMHADFLEAQRRWYWDISNHIQGLVGGPEFKRAQGGLPKSSHHIHKNIHVVSAWFVIVAAIGMALYSRGWGPDLLVKHEAPPTATPDLKPPAAAAPHAEPSPSSH